MKFRLGRGTLIGLLGIGLAGCAHFLNGGADSDEWTAHMPELGRTFTIFLPNLNSVEGLTEAVEGDRLTEAQSTLRHLTSTIKSTEEASHVDPNLSLTSAQFDASLRASSAALRNNRYDEAFKNLNDVNRHCLSCHALLETHNSPFAVDLPAHFEKMSYLQRGDFYLGTLRYSDASYEYERGLLDPSWAQLNKREWNDHMQRLMSIVVRDRNSPEFTREVLTRFYETNAYPNELRKYVVHWRRHISEWKVEERQKISPYKTAVAHASALMLQASKEEKINGRDSVRILALRASGILQREIATNKAAAKNPQVLYISGLALSYLGDAELGPLPEFFFERCVLATRSATSAQCFAKLTELVRKNPLTAYEKSRLDSLGELVNSTSP